MYILLPIEVKVKPVSSHNMFVLLLYIILYLLQKRRLAWIKVFI